MSPPFPSVISKHGSGNVCSQAILALFSGDQAHSLTTSSGQPRVPPCRRAGIHITRAFIGVLPSPFQLPHYQGSHVRVHLREKSRPHYWVQSWVWWLTPLISTPGR